MSAINGRSHARFATSHTCVFSEMRTHALSRHSPFASGAPRVPSGHDSSGTQLWKSKVDGQSSSFSQASGASALMRPFRRQSPQTRTMLWPSGELCMTEMNGICEQWYDATVGPPCRPAAALTIGMFATWLSTIAAVLVIVAKGLLGSKAKRA